jgi:hypothetical protein
MSLDPFARQAAIMAVAFDAEAAACTDGVARIMFHHMARAWERAAKLAEDQIAADRLAHACTLDHRALKGPTCPACGARCTA